eukprot:746523-Prorocentrum_minimum.AAC.1
MRRGGCRSKPSRHRSRGRAGAAPGSPSLPPLTSTGFLARLVFLMPVTQTTFRSSPDFLGREDSLRSFPLVVEFTISFHKIGNQILLLEYNCGGRTWLSVIPPLMSTSTDTGEVFSSSLGGRLKPTTWLGPAVPLVAPVRPRGDDGGRLVALRRPRGASEERPRLLVEGCEPTGDAAPD